MWNLRPDPMNMTLAQLLETTTVSIHPGGAMPGWSYRPRQIFG
jgi:hypothetical protein